MANTLTHPIGSPRNAAVRDYLVAQIEALVVDGVPYNLAAHGAPVIQVAVSSWPDAGITLDATLAGNEPLRLTVQDRHLGLPSFAKLPYSPPRSDWMAPAPLGDLADSAIVRGSVTVE